MIRNSCHSGKHLVQHPFDCSRYIVCDSNKNVSSIVSCPTMQLFNHDIGICDHSYYVSCKIDCEAINRVNYIE